LRALIGGSGRAKREDYVTMLHFGAWATVTGLIGPLMVYGDRFLVSAAVGAAVLAYYAVPQEGLQRLLMLPNAICSALLVRLASLPPGLALGEYQRNLRRVALWHGAVCACAALLAFPVFSVWISREFAAAAIGVTLVLCLGVWINGVALVPYTLIHAQGNPRTTALFHLGELILYAAAVWWLTVHYGILGAAWAWTFRATLDLALLLLATRRYSTDRANALPTTISL
jgi:O-antigen/teichoic acid export membrane protein